MTENTEGDSRELQRNESAFEWDDESRLYFHASSGFYHDPNAGWYYSSRDGLYYKYENENYVLLGSDKGDQSEWNQCGGTVLDDSSTVHSECGSSHLPENPPPPSEWLEDTLIDLYLSGYSDQANNMPHDRTVSMETNGGNSSNLSADGAGNNDIYELEEGEWIPDGIHAPTDSPRSSLEEGASWDEEKWKAQYGQVIQSNEESVLDFSAVDLWDWTMVTRTGKDGKNQVARLAGRLVRPSTKLHPSMPSGGSLLKTAPISEVHFDLVRVRSGQIYKLKSPSAKYLGSLSMYDSSNPTKDWGFPELSVNRQIQKVPKSVGNCKAETIMEVFSHKDLSLVPDKLCASRKHRSHAYRDRAAERRALHGGFGASPEQKNSELDDDFARSSSGIACQEEAAAGSLNMSFGDGSYAKRILECMGWKEGEALGCSTKGLTEPLQAVGNKGKAGLGWVHSRMKHN